MSTFTFDNIVMGNGTISRDCYKRPLLSVCNKSIESSFKTESFYNEGDTILTKSNMSQTLLLPEFQNGLLGTIFTAYSRHIPLKLTPDDIWIAILIAFAKYVKKNSEIMRQKCVKHEDKKALTIQLFGDTVENIDNWEAVLELFVDKMVEHTQDDIVAWSVCDFSTSTSKEKFISRIALFSGFSNFFKPYARMCCGLSKVTLEGTLDDWKQILQKAQKLYIFDQPILSQWADVLIPVLNEFVDAYRGNVNTEFWQRICTYKPQGSGSDKNLRGWFMVFSPFNQEGNYILRSPEQIKADNIYCDIINKQVPSCCIETQILIDDIHGTQNVTLFAGLLMTDYNSDTNELSPTRDYAIIKATYVDERMLEQSFTEHAARAAKGLGGYDADKYNRFYKFLFFLCTELNVSNNLWLKLSRSLALYASIYRGVISEKVLNQIYASLSVKYGLQEFFPKEKKDEVVKKFLQQYPIEVVN
jgi:hypothetical protein